MDPDATRPMPSSTVIYRCACGAELNLDPATGGACTNCNKTITSKALGHELALTMTIDEGRLELDQTQHRGELGKTATVRTMLPSELFEDEDAEVLIGEQFGHFELVSTLGRGGMGQVYLALDTSLQRYVAVKLLRSGIGTNRGMSKSSDQEVDKLLQEAVSQARVTHPNIVTIYYVGKQDGDPFLAMELINGKPLNDRIAEGVPAFNETAEIALQICEALKYSYELDIVHGDIKPSNVLLQHNGLAKLSDFGMARRISDSDDQAVGGTPNYIAPELLRGEKPSIQSDMYALGVTLYEMSFGELPVSLTGKTTPQWLAILDASQITFPVPWPDHLPEAWREFLAKMLAKEPADRFDDYDELIAELKRLRPGSQVKARVFPRVVAAVFDWMSVLVIAIFLQIAFQLTSFVQFTTQHPIVTLFVDVIDILPIVFYLAVIYFWRQSVGRSLMHIRVVNRYGLTPSPNCMLVRSLLRMQFPWFLICFSLISEPTASWLGIAMIGLVAVSGVTLLVDLAVMAVFDRGRSLHDLLVDTRVVLDTRD